MRHREPAHGCATFGVVAPAVARGCTPALAQPGRGVAVVSSRADAVHTRARKWWCAQRSIRTAERSSTASRLRVLQIQYVRRSSVLPRCMRGLRPGRDYREQAVAPDAIAGVEACGAQPLEMALDGMVMIVVPGMREHPLDFFVV
jgi:hypothetical protein